MQSFVEIPGDVQFYLYRERKERQLRKSIKQEEEERRP